MGLDDNNMLLEAHADLEDESPFEPYVRREDLVTNIVIPSGHQLNMNTFGERLNTEESLRPTGYGSQDQNLTMQGVQGSKQPTLEEKYMSMISGDTQMKYKGVS